LSWPECGNGVVIEVVKYNLGTGRSTKRKSCSRSGRNLQFSYSGFKTFTKYDATLFAALAVQRYGLAVPFYRLEKFQANMGVPLPASTQSYI
jgi:hypothetical protein